MSEATAFGEATLTTFIKVEKVDGRVLYYRTEGDETVEIDRETYEREGGE